MKLVIVESPAKSKTIEKLLGPNYLVLSSFGHIRNLDSKSLGVDIENNFEPKYEILSDRSKQIKSIRDTIKNVDKRSEAGATMVEYALIAALIAIVCIGGITILGQSASDKFSSIGSSLTSAPSN